MPKEKVKEYQTLSSRLYLDNKGSIDLDAQLHSHSDAEIQVQVWNNSPVRKLWEGSSAEFWNIILKGIKRHEKECRMKNLEISASGKTTTIPKLLQALSDEELKETFKPIFESLIQEGKME